MLFELRQSPADRCANAAGPCPAASRFPSAGGVTCRKEVWRGRHYSGADRRARPLGVGGGPNRLALRLPTLQAEGEGAGTGSADAARLGRAAGKDARRAADRAGESLRHAGRSGAPAAPAEGGRSARDAARLAERARAPRAGPLAISTPRTRNSQAGQLTGNPACRAYSRPPRGSPTDYLCNASVSTWDGDGSHKRQC